MYSDIPRWKPACVQTDHALCAGFDNILTRTRQEPDLMDRAAVRCFFESERPDYVFDSDKRVGDVGRKLCQAYTCEYGEKFYLRDADESLWA